MIKFIHKKHINKHPPTSKLVIYYSLADAFLGLLLFSLSLFFAFNYLKANSYNNSSNNYAPIQTPTKK